MWRFVKLFALTSWTFHWRLSSAFHMVFIISQMRVGSIFGRHETLAKALLDLVEIHHFHALNRCAYDFPAWQYLCLAWRNEKMTRKSREEISSRHAKLNSTQQRNSSTSVARSLFFHHFLILMTLCHSPSSWFHIDQHKIHINAKFLWTNEGKTLDGMRWDTQWRGRQNEKNNTLIKWITHRNVSSK